MVVLFKLIILNYQVVNSNWVIVLLMRQKYHVIWDTSMLKALPYVKPVGM